MHCTGRDFPKRWGNLAFELAIEPSLKILCTVHDNNVVHLYLLAPESM